VSDGSAWLPGICELGGQTQCTQYASDRTMHVREESSLCIPRDKAHNFPAKSTRLCRVLGLKQTATVRLKVLRCRLGTCHEIKHH
jgi:hypothetical protein